MEQDRIEVLKERIIAMKRECRDFRFAEYLDKMWSDLQNAEHNVHQMERLLEQNYMLYQRQQAAQTMQQPIQQPIQQPVRPVQSVQSVQPPVYAQAMKQQPVYAQPKPQPVAQGYAQPKPQPAQPQGTMEFKIGTVLLGIVGIAFLLVAFVTFGLNFMNDVLQGIFLYAIGIVILASSELFFAKRVEKFSYCLTGLGISSLYITTLLNYIYLKVFPGWVALLITVFITAFFFWLSMKKDSGMIRIICLIGCYISLAPIQRLDNLVQFLLPAIVVFCVNMAGVFCPLKKRRVVVDYVQYTASFILVIYLIYMQWISGLQMWPVFIMISGILLTLHLMHFRTDESTAYMVLYYIALFLALCCMLYVGYHEYWLHYGVLGVAVLCGAMVALFWKKKLRFAPYLYVAVYAISAYTFENNAFALTLACLLVFAINKGCVRFFKEFPIPDAVYTMLSAIGVCCLTRSGDAQILGYIYACSILISCLFVKRFKKYHIFTSLSFAWIFLMTEGMKPFLCSILICILAAIAIAAGFYIKDKSIRIYGLVLMMFVALKLVIYDFYESQAGVRILVFLVVGILILGICFLYICLEKKLMEQQAAQQQIMQDFQRPDTTSM